MNFKSCIFTGSLITLIVASRQQVKAVNINPSHSNNLTIEKISDVSRITQMVFGPDQRLYAITVNQNKAFVTRFNRGPVRQPNGQYSLSYGDVVLVDPTTGDVSQLVQGLFNP